ncbi:MAG: hypothetical protein HN457_12065 [Opitutales bacterium]|jgi:hypothetical protein|nr:hypothetical protein [Opitutales bacterium]MBT5166885.1 hypothetical protein [Opitutales bacterium]MBT5813648.1 hypothetical protein [Opitutales bacterium]
MNLTSEYIEDKTLRVRYGDLILFDYVYRPDTNKQYCPRPYFHPIRALSGDVLTNLRPADHPWHQGLSLTMSSVNGMNFWGGHTYSKETGEYANIDNVGTQLHRDWVDEKALENGYAWTETLDWIGPQRQQVFTETRTLIVRDIDPEIGLWRLVWESEITNTLGETIYHNSYNSGEGLEGSGYTGLFLRMSRGFDRTGTHIFDGKDIPEWDDYHDGETILDSPDQLNGWQSSRLAYQGIFDTSLNGCLLLCEDLTENPPYTHHWFCRPQFPCLAWSTAYHDTNTIGIGETFNLKHSLGIANGLWTKDRAQTLWMGA